MSTRVNGGLRRRIMWPLLCLVLLLPLDYVFSEPAAPVITVDQAPNSAAAEASPYVVLVSLDGFRYDYIQQFGARHLQALAALGATATQGMLPAYPSLTFPNHYTLITGLYPEHHGIVANRFYDPARKQSYVSSDPASNSDGTWYGGTPLWSLAAQQGMRTACFYWPGSEAKIDGQRPTYYLKYDDHFPDEARIDQVIRWLRLSPAQRPHFITLYYAMVDHAGHASGPASAQTRTAVLHADQLIGDLWTRLSQLPVPVDLIIVSDHGMEQEQGPWIDLDQYADLRNFTTDGPLLYPNSEAAAEKAYQELKIKSDAFTVYRRNRAPAALHYDSNAREGDPIVVPNGPYAIRAHAPATGAEDHAPDAGAHGFDARSMKSMRALFIAVGPHIRPGSTLEPFENVHVYPLLASILGLRSPRVDGNVNVLSKILKDGGPWDESAP